MPGVNIDETVRDFRVIKSGIPHGTIFGPILYLVYINNLFNTNTNNKPICYVDNRITLISAKNWIDTFKLVEMKLAQLKTWVHENVL